MPDLDEIIKEYTWLTDDPDGSRIVEHMDMNGVDKSVMFWWDRPASWPRTIPGNQQDHRRDGPALPRSPYPVRDPSTPRANACDMLKRCVGDYGCLRRMKWHPDVHGFIPSDKNNYEFLQLMDDYKMTLVTHCSALGLPSKSLYAHPLLLDEILVDFRNINIIAAHAGWRWWPELAGISWNGRIISTAASPGNGSAWPSPTTPSSTTPCVP